MSQQTCFPQEKTAAFSPRYVAKPSQVMLVVKNLPANAEDIRDAGPVPGLGRSPGGGNGNLLQYSCLENPMDRRAWWAMVHRMKRVGHE